jgi:hypothetical protein
MPSLGVQELLIRQEQLRIERLSRDAWLREQLPPAPVSRWRRAFGRSTTSDDV